MHNSQRIVENGTSQLGDSERKVEWDDLDK